MQRRVGTACVRSGMCCHRLSVSNHPLPCSLWFVPKSRYTRPFLIAIISPLRFLFEVQQDERRLYQALLFLFTLPGPPVLLYGSEALMTHYDDASNCFEISRQAMPWTDGVDGTGHSAHCRKTG